MAYTQLSPHLRPMSTFTPGSSATLNTSIGLVSFSAQITHPVQATLSAVLGQILLSAQVQHPVQPSLAQSIGNIALIAAATVTSGTPTAVAVLDLTLAPIVAAAQSNVLVTGNLEQTLLIMLDAMVNAGTSQSLPTIEVSPGATFVDIYHNAHDVNAPVFVMTNWPTTYWISTSETTQDRARIYFTAPASGPRPLVMWQVAK